MRVFQNGVGEDLGDALVTSSPLQLSGQVWYVSFLSGTDAVSPLGLSREAPLKTLAQAISSSADGDIIVLLDTQVPTATITVNKRVAIVGSGLAGGVPSSGISLNLAAGAALSITVGAVSLRSLKIKTNQRSNVSPRIAVGAADFSMRGCYAECSITDAGPVLSLDAGADRARIVDSSIISTATSMGALPVSAIVSSAALADVSFDGLTVSGGAFGFSSNFAVDLSAGAITRLRAEAVSLLLGADMKLHASTTGWVNVAAATGSSRLEW